MNIVDLSIPTLDNANRAITNFDTDDRYGPAERVLSRVFLNHPFNNTIEDVLIKVVILNALYNTNILAVMEMARHILDLKVDDDLAIAAPQLVDRIANIRIRNKTRRNYSFATKYCNWHRPEDYPIYDGYVERLLLDYQRRYSFANFTKADIQDYLKYKAILTAFKVQFKLNDLSFKQIDKFLWWTSKNLELRKLDKTKS
jgi:hypothetical protein